MIFDFVLDRGGSNPFPCSISSEQRTDFMRLAKPAFITSWVIIAIGIAVGSSGVKARWAGLHRGDSVSFSFQQKVDSDKLREAWRRQRSKIR